MQRPHWPTALCWITFATIPALFASCDSAATAPVEPASDKAASDNDEAPASQAAAASEPKQSEDAHENHAPGIPAKKHEPNRLAGETSPYLLLHAHNPVRWYPWGEEALAKAKAENKLIFLSIGYSSCYWCHVMERESFMDEAIAAILNKHFVAVKIDREERPDIDEIFMTALQVYLRATGAGGSGGWPLSMFLTPDAKPILGGTYFPPRDKDGRTGFITVLGRVQKRWEENAQSLRDSADQLSDFVVQSLKLRTPLAPPKPAAEVSDSVLSALNEQFDPQHGGFGYSAVDPRRPKFPEPSNLMYLLARAKAGADEKARRMLVETLEKMAAGGIRDHLGGGFHRYSTDRYWHIPHFEKMLYDNGQLASVYAEAYALTGDERFRRVVEEMLAFVSRELTDPGGAFYSALDAETDAEEGRFYAWDEEELKRLLTDDEFALFAAQYVGEDGANFEGRYVPLIARTPEAAAQLRSLTPEQLQTQLTDIKAKLLAVRNKRERPLTDTKILTAWNGLMIRGYADAGRLLNNQQYVQSAARAADFVLANLLGEDGRLLRTYGQKQAKLNAYLDDYAFLIDGLIALHKATGGEKWLAAADRLMSKQIELFWDDEAGGFYFTSHDHEQLLARSKDPIDSVLPSGNAVSIGNLAYLAGKLDKPSYVQLADKSIGAFAGYLADFPSGMPRMALAMSAWDAARATEEATPDGK